MIQKTTEKFIEQVQLVHDNKYDYSICRYEGYNVKTTIICKKHGEFKILPTNLLAGSGCKKCAFEKIAKDRASNTASFITKARKIHKHRYDYFLTNYVNNFTNIKIICKKHGVFLQTPVTHLNGSGCKECGFKSSAYKQTMSFESFLSIANKKFNGKYTYNKNNWINRKEPLEIICPYHGKFEQRPVNHLRHSTGCVNCKVYRLSSLKRKDFIQKYKDKLCTFYILYCYDEYESFYKVGITSRTVKQRFDSSNRMPYKYIILLEKRDMAGSVWDLEAKLKSLLSKERYKPKQKFNGSKFECFNTNPTDLIN